MVARRREPPLSFIYTQTRLTCSKPPWGGLRPIRPADRQDSWSGPFWPLETRGAEEAGAKPRRSNGRMGTDAVLCHVCWAAPGVSTQSVLDLDRVAFHILVNGALQQPCG